MAGSSPAGDRSASTRRSDVIRPGDLIGGKYRVDAILGRDRGLLLDATHAVTDQRVAIELLPAGHGDDKEIERFRREGRTLAKLESEHVARIIDVGSEAGGSLYLVRQYLEGVDLARYLRRSGPLPLAEAVLLIAQAAEAVAEAHGHGVILRELAPSSLFLTQRAGSTPLLKVIDFGTAKPQRDANIQAAGVELTATAMFGISPYASPELVRKAKNIDLRMDVWSLGAIFYEMLAGRPPFTGETAMLMLQITKEHPVPVALLRSDLPRQIDQIIGWALAKDVDRRFRDVHAFLHTLLPYAPAEAQILIERIGQITRAAEARQRGAGAESAVRPLPTVIAPPLSRPPMVIASALSRRPMLAPSALLRPPRLGESLGPSSSPRDPSRASAVPPRAEDVAAPATPAAPPAQPSRPVDAVRPTRDRSDVYNGVAFLAGSIPVLLAFVALRVVQPGKGGVTAESTAQLSQLSQLPSTTEASAALPPVKEPQATAPATPREQDAPSSPANETELASAAHSAEVDHQAKRTASRSRSKVSRWAVPAPRSSRPDGDEDPPTADAPSSKGAPASSSPASSAETGTLFAVVTGGGCAFSVNGVPRGTSTSIKLSVPPGTYSVSCRSSSEETMSRKLIVKEGRAVFATFKSQGST